ncbi:hypothetical protein [Massilia niastensis]|uniref:hypothetical protein n=1 Tax=Massilia niastensis TaxID=544911 RepID=UPI0003A9A7CE|nr:hypothetical protein [Massilia niastensis]
MCGNEKVRYVHIMERLDLDKNFDVGCVCAEKRSGDYEGPKRLKAQIGAAQRAEPDGCSAGGGSPPKGNGFLNVDGHNLGVHMNNFKR